MRSSTQMNSTFGRSAARKADSKQNHNNCHRASHCHTLCQIDLTTDFTDSTDKSVGSLSHIFIRAIRVIRDQKHRFEPVAIFDSAKYDVKPVSRIQPLRRHNVTHDHFALCRNSLPSIALAADAKKPNIILILADDLGYETIGANGGKSYKTPNLDRARRHRRALRTLLRAAALHADARAAHDRHVQRAELHRLRPHGPEGDHVRQSPQAGRLRHRASPASGSSAATSTCRSSSASTNTASGSTRAGRRATPIPAWRSTASERTTRTANTVPTSSTTTRSTSSRATRTSRSFSTTR